MSASRVSNLKDACPKAPILDGLLETSLVAILPVSWLIFFGNFGNSSSIE
jgi:hypothetical protein